MNKIYCLFSANYLPNLGGVERYTYNLGKKLIEKGNKVIVVTNNTDKLKYHEIIEEIEIFRMPCYNILNGRFPVLKYNKQFRLLYKELLELPIDYVLVNTRFYIHSFLGVRFAKRMNIKPIVIEHGTNHFTINNKFFDFCGHFYEHFITKIITKYCDSFYGVSEACTEWLEHFGIKADGILYNAIDSKKITELMKEPIDDYRKQLAIKSDDIIITYTGRLVKEKGIIKLIEAFIRLYKEQANIHLCIAGDGDLYEEIRQLRIENIHILGRIDFENVISLLSQTDIFCLPTDYPEGFPTSVLEAACCKCFIITTTAGGSKELINDEKHGIIMKYNTVDEIYNSLKRVISKKEYHTNAVNITYQKLIDNFTWDIVADKVIKLKL